MVAARAEKTILRSADDVWARIGDFGDLSWVPGVESVALEGDERSIRMRGLSITNVQRLLSHDDASRSYSYCVAGELDLSSVLGPGKVMRHLEATLTVTPTGALSSNVTHDVDTEEFLVEGTRAEYQRALDSVKAELEG